MNLINKSNDIIDEKLDIVYYIRKMISFDIINQISLENKNIIDFLCKPIIYLKNKTKEIKPEISDTETNASSMNKNGKRNSIKNNNNEFLQYSKDERYKSAYKLNLKDLSKSIEDLILTPNKTIEQKNLLEFLKKQLNEV